jgi:A1 cistron-splicing factor AAR2
VDHYTYEIKYAYLCVICDVSPGVSLIPPGLHFVYHGTGMGARQGFFVQARKNDIIVTSWNPANEEISFKPLITDEAVDGLRRAVLAGELNRNLGPYPISSHGTWVNLSNFISDSVLHRAGVPVGRLIYPGEAEDMATGIPKLDSIKPYFPDLATQARLSAADEMELKLLEELAAKKDTSPADISKMRMDKSVVVANLVSSYFNGSYNDLLGEIQLSFLLFMLLYSEPALKHWKKTVNLICSCEDLVFKKTQFFSAFLRVLYEQLHFSPDDFFETELSRENFLRPALTNLFQILDSPKISEGLGEHRKRLFAFVKKKFGLFSEDDEHSEYLRHAGNLGHAIASIDEGNEYFNLMEEDRPVVLPEAEVAAAMDRETHLMDTDDSNHIHISESDFNKPGFEHAEKPVWDSPPLDFEAMQREKYSWRYPDLYGSLLRGPDGRYCEDMTMAAMRILEQSNYAGEDVVEEMKQTEQFIPAREKPFNERVVIEARMFIENELMHSST